jgi:hypothetical protein
MMLVASRSIYHRLGTEKETFANSQLWKNLLRHGCKVWIRVGERKGRSVEVGGSNKRARSYRDPMSTPTQVESGFVLNSHVRQLWKACYPLLDAWTCCRFLLAWTQAP